MLYLDWKLYVKIEGGKDLKNILLQKTQKLSFNWNYQKTRFDGKKPYWCRIQS